MVGSGLNRLRRIATPGGWLVERSWHPVVLAEFGADMHAEVAAQRLAAAQGLAPPVLEFDPAARVMRMPWVEGAALEADWADRAGRRAAMRELLGRLRTVPASALPALDLPQRLRWLHDRLAARDPRRAAHHGPAVEAAIGAWSAATDPARSPAVQDAAPCLVHGDLTPGNILVRGDGSLLLLDWEYARAGGPWDDLAGLCAAADGEPFADWVEAVPIAARPRFAAERRLRRCLDALWYDLRAALQAPAQAGIRPRPEAH